MDTVLRVPASLKSITLRRRWLMVGMLVLLHAAMALEIESLLARGLLISHLGVFLLWQPMWRGQSQISRGGMAFIAVACVAVLVWLSWWLVAFWVTGLFALVGGKVFSSRAAWPRLFYLTVMFYLLASLLIWVVPQMFDLDAVTETTASLMYYALPMLFLGMALMPVEEEPAGFEQVVDFFFSVMLFMLVMVLVLGAFAFMSHGKTDYLAALVQTVFIMAAALMVLGLLWNPRFGFSGLQQLFSRYLLNVGTPFEQWLSQLAHAAETEREPSGFLEVAARQLAEMPWVKGVAWEAPDGSGELGELERNNLEMQAGQLNLKLATRYSVSPAVMLHANLLAQIIGRFYEAKRREHALHQMTRLQAIYETGARLTHDVKNLLQSLYTLASAAQQAVPPGEFQQLLMRQLPQLTQRLELTLSKLQEPKAEPGGDYIEAGAWWQSLEARYEGRCIEFVAELTNHALLPVGLFDCVVENLLDNARKKRMSEPGISITVRFRTEDSIALSVCDTGTPVPSRITNKLFRNTVESETGLGIGLYQAYRWAAQQGYRLSVTKNEPAGVCFELAQEPVNK